MASDNDPKVSNIAQHVMAKDQADSLEAYVQRGRKYSSTSSDELKRLFLEAYQRWARDISDPTTETLRGDIGAEYSLRNEEPPYDLIEAEIEAISRAMAARMDSLTEEEKSAINDRLVEEYDAIKKRSS